jgi:hypothetical protein
VRGIMRVSKHLWPLLYLWLVLAYAFGIVGMFLFAYKASSPEGRQVCRCPPQNVLLAPPPPGPRAPIINRLAA